MKIILISSVAVIFLMACASPETKAPEGKAVSEAKAHNCGMCHQPHKREGKMLLNKPIYDLCISCHPERTGTKEHKVNIKPSMPVDELPLDAEGKITCLTCHDPHGEKGFDNLLRAPSFNEICKKCHKYY